MLDSFKESARKEEERRLLEESEIYRLCQEPVTLEKFLNNGGKAILKDEFDTSRVLEPFAQLRLLSRILMSVKSKAA